ncbi:MAG TPA: hypothetical protein VH593_29080 [Ktedonobacteraceae bacterium]
MNGWIIAVVGWLFGAALFGWAASRWFRYLRYKDGSDESVREAGSLHDGDSRRIPGARTDRENSGK